MALKIFFITQTAAKFEIDLKLFSQNLMSVCSNYNASRFYAILTHPESQLMCTKSYFFINLPSMSDGRFQIESPENRRSLDNLSYEFLVQFPVTEYSLERSVSALLRGTKLRYLLTYAALSHYGLNQLEAPLDFIFGSIIRLVQVWSQVFLHKYFLHLLLQLKIYYQINSDTKIIQN